MPLFPDEFPFKKPLLPATQSAPAPAPIVEDAQPSAAAPEVAAPTVAAPVVVVPIVAAPLAPAPIPVLPEENIEIPPEPAPVRLTHERRRSPRQVLVARGLIRHEVGNAPGWKVDLLNVSMMGMRFRSTDSMVPGDKAFVKLEVGPLRWAAKLRVVHCSKLDSGEWSIGCEFVANELARPSARAAA
jgi:hypothetical protein